MKKTHYTNFDNNCNKIEMISDAQSSKLMANGQVKWESNKTGHQFTACSMFENCRDLIANW